MFPQTGGAGVQPANGPKPAPAGGVTAEPKVVPVWIDVVGFGVLVAGVVAIIVAFLALQGTIAGFAVAFGGALITYEASLLLRSRRAKTAHQQEQKGSRRSGLQV